MIKSMNRRAFFALAAATALAACVTPTLVTGEYKLGKDYAVTLSSSWSDATALAGQGGAKVRLLTIDGPLLNRLYLSEGLAEKASLVRTTVKEKPTPAVRAGMTSTELVEFVADSVVALGYERVETAEARPAKFGAVDAIRFDMTAQTARGLAFRGTAKVAERAGKVYVMLYLAPQEHYYAARLADVEAVFNSATLPAAS